jgi:tetratricopeptide (TPR) repeat protein
MTVYGCSAWACNRLISVSVIPGGNPTALAKPDRWAVRFSVCEDCKHTFCDRCVERRRVAVSASPGCWRCGGRLVAGEHLQEVNGRRGADVALHLGRGERLCEEGNGADALVELDRALALRPSCPAARFWRGVALDMVGRRAEAIAALESAVDVEPFNAQALFKMALVLAQEQRIDESIAAYDRAIVAEPGLTAAMVNKAAGLVELGHIHQALDVVDRAIRLEDADQGVGPNRKIRHYALGIKGDALYRLGHYAEAVETLEAAISSGPDLAPTYWLLARSLEMVGRAVEAANAQRIYERLTEPDG